MHKNRSTIAHTVHESIKTATKIIEYAIIILEYICLPAKPAHTRKANNIILVGGELFNKGAQAMTFTAVTALKQKFPDKNIYLFSTRDFKRSAEEKNNLSFHILPWRWKTKVSLFSRLNFLFRKRSKLNHQIKVLKEVIADGCLFIDISGYALSSQWSLFRSMDYLLNIMIAKKFSVPYYIFPQSIGPFHYRLRDKLLLSPLLLKSCLKYPTKIFAREDKGFNSVSRFTRSNLYKSCDIVLYSKGYSLAHIYRNIPHVKNFKIEPGSVGIIPNVKVMERTDQEDMYALYNAMIERLIKADKTVYLLRHSHEDVTICRKIKSYYPDNQNIKLLSDDFSAIELENIIKQFDFLVVSRYHAIIHSYRNGVPVLAIGWADKYHELLEEFKQLDYFVDMREGLDRKKITDMFGGLISHYRTERKKITQRFSSMARENIFDSLYC